MSKDSSSEDVAELFVGIVVGFIIIYIINVIGITCLARFFQKSVSHKNVVNTFPAQNPFAPPGINIPHHNNGNIMFNPPPGGNPIPQPGYINNGQYPAGVNPHYGNINFPPPGFVNPNPGNINNGQIYGNPNYQALNFHPVNMNNGYSTPKNSSSTLIEDKIKSLFKIYFSSLLYSLASIISVGYLVNSKNDVTISNIRYSSYSDIDLYPESTGAVYAFDSLIIILFVAFIVFSCLSKSISAKFIKIFSFVILILNGIQLAVQASFAKQSSDIVDYYKDYMSFSNPYFKALVAAFVFSAEISVKFTSLLIINVLHFTRSLKLT
jgi:hypothetical protein